MVLLFGFGLLAAPRVSVAGSQHVASLLFPCDGQVFSRVGGHFRFEAKSDNVATKKVGELIE